MISVIMQFLGGAPYPVFETGILLTIITFSSAIYFGLKFDAEKVKSNATTDNGEENVDL